MSEPRSASTRDFAGAAGFSEKDLVLPGTIERQPIGPADVSIPSDRIHDVADEANGAVAEADVNAAGAGVQAARAGLPIGPVTRQVIIRATHAGDAHTRCAWNTG